MFWEGWGSGGGGGGGVGHGSQLEGGARVLASGKTGDIRADVNRLIINPKSQVRKQVADMLFQQLTCRGENLGATLGHAGETCLASCAVQRNFSDEKQMPVDVLRGRCQSRNLLQQGAEMLSASDKGLEVSHREPPSLKGINRAALSESRDWLLVNTKSCRRRLPHTNILYHI